jgi:hypothetical protein
MLTGGTSMEESKEINGNLIALANAKGGAPVKEIKLCYVTVSFPFCPTTDPQTFRYSLARKICEKQCLYVSPKEISECRETRSIRSRYQRTVETQLMPFFM